jgi:hypothetical protein
VSTTRRRHAYGAAFGLVAGGDRRPHPPQRSSLSCTAIGLMAHPRGCRLMSRVTAPAGAARTRPLRRPGDANFIQCDETKGNANHTSRQTVVCAAVTDERLRTRHVAAPLGSVLRSRRASSGRFISCAPAPHGSNHALTTVDGRACSMQHA